MQSSVFTVQLAFTATKIPLQLAFWPLLALALLLGGEV